jgi:hypothetical protein
MPQTFQLTISENIYFPLTALQYANTSFEFQVTCTFFSKTTKQNRMVKEKIFKTQVFGVQTII